MVKTVSYTHTNSYEILNAVTPSTQHIWICLHGLGYLAKYFKRYFTVLDAGKHAVIVPQAPAKYYQDTEFKHVGASWLTRVDRDQEMINIKNYLHQVLHNENIHGDPRIVLMGYSQGVSIATRFLIDYCQPIKAIILHSGSIPEELDENHASDFQNLSERIIHISGTRDEYVTTEIIERENKKIEMLFGTKCELHRPDIKHEVDVQLLLEISKTL
jgi:predicted esterase